MVSDDFAISVVIPHIPVRPEGLLRAVESAMQQWKHPYDVIISTDTQRRGSAETRNRGLLKVETEWVAFLDDDDEFMPHHLYSLLRHAKETGADVAYSGCVVLDKDGNTIPLQEEWGRFGQKFDPNLLREKSYLPVTSLVRTSLARQALFGPPEGVDTPYDDWGFYLRLLDLGAMFSHDPEVTWIWHHDGNNTSGQPDRW